MFEGLKNFFDGGKKEDPVSHQTAVRAAANKEIQKILEKDPSLLKNVEQLEKDNPDLIDGEKAA